MKMEILLKNLLSGVPCAVDAPYLIAKLTLTHGNFPFFSWRVWSPIPRVSLTVPPPQPLLHLVLKLGEGRMEEAKTFIDKDYRAERYRSLYSLYGDPAFCVGPLIPCMLEKDPSFLPPADVEGKSGRPKKGPRKRARLPVNGEFHNLPVTASAWNSWTARGSERHRADCRSTVAVIERTVAECAG